MQKNTKGVVANDQSRKGSLESRVHHRRLFVVILLVIKHSKTQQNLQIQTKIKGYKKAKTLLFSRVCHFWWRGVDSFNSAGLNLFKSPSVSTERWFGTQSVRVVKQHKTTPYKRKSTQYECFFWWRGVDSNHRSH